MTNPGHFVSPHLAGFISSLVTNGDFIVVGTRLPLPRAGVLLAAKTHAPRIHLVRGFNFIADPASLPLSEVGQFFQSEPNDQGPDENIRHTFSLSDQFAYARRVDLFFIGALQVDPHGRSNLLGIPDASGGWKFRGPGAIGTTTMATMAKRFLILLHRHERRTFVDQLSACSAPGWLSENQRSSHDAAHPSKGPAFVLTPRCILAPHPISKRLSVLHLLPGSSFDDVQNHTGFFTERHPDFGPLPPLPAPVTELLHSFSH